MVSVDVVSVIDIVSACAEITWPRRCSDACSACQVYAILSTIVERASRCRSVSGMASAAADNSSHQPFGTAHPGE